MYIPREKAYSLYFRWFSSHWVSRSCISQVTSQDDQVQVTHKHVSTFHQDTSPREFVINLRRAKPPHHPPPQHLKTRFDSQAPVTRRFPQSRVSRPCALAGAPRVGRIQPVSRSDSPQPRLAGACPPSAATVGKARSVTAAINPHFVAEVTILISG